MNFSRTSGDFDFHHDLNVSCAPQMSTQEKLLGRVMEEAPVGSRNKVTVVGVGMVGMASAVSVLLKVSSLS